MESPFVSQMRTRRHLLKQAALLGLAVPLAPALSACATGGSDSGKSSQGTKSSANPFGVKDTTALEVVIFKGGYGDDYAKAHEALYTQKYPKAKVSHQGIQKISEALQPRFNAGNPPDVIDDSGAGQIKLDTLIADNQLMELTPLLDAPSVDDPAKKVREMLLPGTVEAGVYNGKVYALNYGFTVWGVWYSKSLFDKHGWQYPKSWDEFMALCATIKAAGIAPWIHQGKYPYYMMVPIMDLVAMNGGLDVQKKIDNLEPNAWKDPAVKQAVEGIYELVSKGYVLPGAEGMTHTESQTAWNQGKAAFIPCGTWLENEQKAQTPAGFDMVVAPMPAMSGSKLPFGAVRAGAGEPFVVPAKAKNSAGGLEYLRIMCSKAGGQKFAELTSSLSVVKDSAGAVSSTGVKSTVDVYTAAGSNVFTWRYLDWYSQLASDAENATGELMANRIKPDEWISRIQASADKTAADSSIKKYKRD
jgi:N-acetylglucosamine transport system substrate-binding protein